MAYTLTQLAIIENAIATGALRVEMDGRMVIYQKVDDLLRVRDMMRAELDVEVPVTARGRAWRPIAGTGL